MHFNIITNYNLPLYYAGISSMSLVFTHAFPVFNSHNALLKKYYNWWIHRTKNLNLTFV